MVRVNVITDKNGNYKQITLKGHADYKACGNDIVCASVSATYLCTVNAILLINNKAIDVCQNASVNIINVVDNDEIVKKLLDNMIRCFKSIEKEYPKNINVK